MTAKEYLETKKRTCNNFTECVGCPFGNSGLMCDDITIEEPDEAIAIVEKWGKEHPIATLMDKFFEAFPDAPRRKGGYAGTPNVCPYDVGYENSKCGHIKGNCLQCWSQPYIEPKGEKK